MATITVNTGYGDQIECRDFHDIVGTSTEVSGVEVYREGERLGSIIGVSVPDENDEEEVLKFQNEVEVWLVDNEY